MNPAVRRFANPLVAKVTQSGMVFSPITRALFLLYHSCFEMNSYKFKGLKVPLESTLAEKGEGYPLLHAGVALREEVSYRAIWRTQLCIGQWSSYNS